MPGMINIGAGLSAAGGAVANWAGEMSANQMKMDMERQSITLSNQLAAEREHSARVETGAPEEVAAKRLGLITSYRQLDAQMRLSGHPNGLKDFDINSPEELLSKGPPAVATRDTGRTAPSSTSEVLPAGTDSSMATSALDRGGAAPGASGEAGILPFSVGKKGQVTAVSTSGQFPPGWNQTMADAYPAAYAEALKEYSKPRDVRAGGGVGHYEGGNFVSDYQQPATGATRILKDGVMVPIPGAAAGIAEAEGAKEAGKAGYELVTVYDPETQTNKMVTRAEALRNVHEMAGLPAPRQEGPAPAVGAQGDNSFKMPDGSVIPPAPKILSPKGGVVQAGPSAADKATQENYAKVIGEWNASVVPAAQGEAQAFVMAQALKAIQSGAWASTKAEIARQLIASGLDEKTVEEIARSEPAQAQILMKNNFALALNQLSASRLGRITQNEIFASQKQLANPDLEPEANLSILSEGIGIARWQQSLAAGWNVARQMGYDPLSYQAEWVKANPVQKFMDAAKKEIGPLKGMGDRPTQFKEGELREQNGEVFKYTNGKFVHQGPAQ